MTTTTIDRRPGDFAVVCIDEFAHRKGLTKQEAYTYLSTYKGLDYLDEFYDVEHTLSLDDVIDDLTLLCANNGGHLS